MSREAKIGLIVLVAIVAGFWGVQFLMGKNIFNKGRMYNSLYMNTSGLTVSSPVTYEGTKVGLVKHITLEKDSITKKASWRVAFSIDNNDLEIPYNTIAKIGGDLLGSKSIQLVLGSSDTLALSGAELTPDLQMDITDEIKQQFIPLKKKTEELVIAVDGVLASLGAIFEDDATQALPESFKSLQNSLKILETTSGRVDGMIAENREKFGSVMSNVNEITKTFKNNTGALDTIITNFSNISDSLAQIQFEVIINKVSNTLDQVASITEKVNNGEGSLGQLINSDSLVVELQQSNQELQYLLNDIYTNPKKYLSFSVIGRKDRNGFSNQEEDRIKEIIKEEN